MALSGLIAGLGNPGQEYASTRHNFGFLTVDAFVRSLPGSASVRSLSGNKDGFELYRAQLATERGMQEWLFAKPLTYMNRSGEPVRRIMDYYRLEPEDALIVHDELDLPLGRMKMKRGGGNAGHNGLKSLCQHLGTPNFLRLRLGVGRPAGYDAASYVLARFSSAEHPALEETLKAACQAIRIFLDRGEVAAQRFANGFAFPGSEDG